MTTPRHCLLIALVPLLLSGCGGGSTSGHGHDHPHGDGHDHGDGHGHDHGNGHDHPHDEAHAHDDGHGHPHDDDHDHDEAHAHGESHGHPHDDEHDATAAANTLAIPSAVRANLGLAFATVEQRAVAATRRVPGAFEPRVDGHRQLRAPLAGRVVAVAELLSEVDPAQPVYRLDAPAWIEHQSALSAAVARVEAAQAELVARRTEHEVARLQVAALTQTLAEHRQHNRALRDARDLWLARVRELEELAAATGGLRAELAEARGRAAEATSTIAEAHEKLAELESQRQVLLAELGIDDLGGGAQPRGGVLRARSQAAAAALEAARSEFEALLQRAALLTGLPLASLRAEVDGLPRWQALVDLPVHAAGPAVVDAVEVGVGGWVEAGDPLLDLVDPSALRFRARGLQADLPQLAHGQPARIVPVARAEGRELATMHGRLQVSPHGDAQSRTVDLVVIPEELADWARPGIAAYLEYLRPGASAEPVVAVPLAAVVRDGLERVVFRRDPDDPDRVERVALELGADDGRWVTVHAGLAPGDRVVTDGAYELKLALDEEKSGGPQGGHYHADGSFHAGEH